MNANSSVVRPNPVRRAPRALDISRRPTESRWAEAFLRDAVYALRWMRRSAGTALLMALCLGLGIGANTVLFGTVSALLFRPPDGVSDPSRLVRMTFGAGTGRLSPVATAATYPQYLELRRQAPYLRDLAAYAPRALTLGSGAEAESLSGLIVSENYFEVLGAKPQLGRFFRPRDAELGDGAPVAVLSYGFWRRAMAQSRSVIGRVIKVNGTPLTVVGVARDGFVGVDLGSPDVWLPMALAASESFGGSRQLTDRVHWLRLVGRLAPGLSSGGIARVPPLSLGEGLPELPVQVTELRTTFGADQGGQNPVPPWVLGVSLILLLIACATVANLLLCQAVSRTREIGTRVALGASPFRIIRQYAAEGFVLAVATALAGLAFAWLASRLVQTLPIPPVSHLIDAKAVAFGVLLSLVAALSAALLPSVWISTGNTAPLLRQAAGQTDSGRSRLRGTLMIAQMALSFVLLTCAALFVQSFRRATNTSPGFALSRLVVASIDLRSENYQPLEAAAFFQRASEEVRRLGGVDGVAIGSTLPFYMFMTVPMAVPDEQLSDEQPESALLNYVTPGYFRALGIQLLSGRDFEAADRTGSPEVAIVNELFARQRWPRASPIGRCVRIGGADQPCSSVVAVVSNAHLEKLIGTPAGMVYKPLDQARQRYVGAYLFARVKGDPARAAMAIHRQVQALDARLPFVEALALMDKARPQLIPWRVAATLFTVFGLMALAIASVGLYTLVAFAVNQRAREFAIRMAVGASGARLALMVLTLAVRASAWGVAIGIGAAFLVRPVLARALYGIGSFDVATLAGIALLLLLVTVGASAVPAWRVARVAPAEALRME